MKKTFHQLKESSIPPSYDRINSLIEGKVTDYDYTPYLSRFSKTLSQNKFRRRLFLLIPAARFLHLVSDQNLRSPYRLLSRLRQLPAISFPKDIDNKKRYGPFIMKLSTMRTKGANEPSRARAWPSSARTRLFLRELGSGSARFELSVGRLGSSSLKNSEARLVLELDSRFYSTVDLEIDLGRNQDKIHNKSGEEFKHKSHTKEDIASSPHSSADPQIPSLSRLPVANRSHPPAIPPPAQPLNRYELFSLEQHRFLLPKTALIP
ncbi:hypothetical protein LXL04_030506 [Taraxacum kok-saghyz]